jgi:metal-dependent amidase/aminoacylase/carboxypeptidase family protein
MEQKRDSIRNTTDLRHALHNPSYDFPDQLTETGIAMYMRIIERTPNT